MKLVLLLLVFLVIAGQVSAVVIIPPSSSSSQSSNSILNGPCMMIQNLTIEQPILTKDAYVLDRMIRFVGSTGEPKLFISVYRPSDGKILRLDGWTDEDFLSYYLGLLEPGKKIWVNEFIGGRSWGT